MKYCELIKGKLTLQRLTEAKNNEEIYNYIRSKKMKREKKSYEIVVQIRRVAERKERRMCY